MNRNVKIFIYSSSHLTKRHQVLAPFLKEMNDIPNKVLLVRAVGGKQLDENVIYNVTHDMTNDKNCIMIFLFGDNDLRSNVYDRNVYLNRVSQIFKLTQTPSFEGTLVWNGLIPNPENKRYNLEAKMIDQEVKFMALEFPKVETADLTEQFEKVQSINAESILGRDLVHFNEKGGFYMAKILGSQVKACVAKRRLKMDTQYFSVFNRKDRAGRWWGDEEKDPQVKLEKYEEPRNEGFEPEKSKNPRWEKYGCDYIHEADGTHLDRETGESLDHGCYPGSLQFPVGIKNMFKNEFLTDYHESTPGEEREIRGQLKDSLRECP